MTTATLKSRTVSAHGLGAAAARRCREAAAETLPSLLMLTPVFVMIGILLLSIHASFSIMMRVLPLFGTVLFLMLLATTAKTNFAKSPVAPAKQTMPAAHNASDWVF